MTSHEQATGPREAAARGGRHAVFRTRMLRLRVPAPGGDTVDLQCPNCAAHAAIADRVGNRLYGSHDGPSGCGWTDTLTIGRDRLGATTLT